ncbi:MAG: DMT family protein [Oligosphaeraceae bacterium]|nr:DMT family protein [Oligosphaeraceae bacterium]
MPKLFQTLLLLFCSNMFMTYAWYGHLRHFKHRAWILAVLASWGIAFFEYLLQVPANRIGNQVLSVSQLKIIQEAISLSVFVPFAIFFLGEKWNWNFLWASFCLLLAVFFIFRT